VEIKERFIILKKLKYSESDLIVHAISVHGEKVSFIARGALKSKKRFGGGVLEPTHFVQLTYKQTGEGGKLNPIAEASLLNDFHKIRRSYDHLELALTILDCVSRVCQEGDKYSESIFNLLGNALKAVESCEDVQLLKMHFYLKLLFQQGVLTVEPWMAPFLKTNIADVNGLVSDLNLKKETTLHMSQIEFAAQQYIKTAEHH
jgi:DNA repair protein RecO (recombination protein O)